MRILKDFKIPNFKFPKLKMDNLSKIDNVEVNYEDVKNTLVLDPYEVVTNSLINATSIAGMLLTTTSLVINEYSNNIKNNDFNEL